MSFLHQQHCWTISNDATVWSTVYSAEFYRASPVPPPYGRTCSDLCTLVHAGLNCASCSNSITLASAQVPHWSSALLDGVIRLAVHFIVYTPRNGDICEKANKNIPPARNSTGISSATPGYDSFSVVLFSQNPHREGILALCSCTVCVCMCVCVYVFPFLNENNWKHACDNKPRLLFRQQMFGKWLQPRWNGEIHRSVAWVKVTWGGGRTSRRSVT